MFLARWLRAARVPRPTSAPARRLGVETLEDRTTPAAAAVITALGAGSGGVQLALTAAVSNPSPAD